MGLEDLGGDGGDLSEDQSDLRIALLAAYIQDYNVSPISPVTRIISPRNRSIYQVTLVMPVHSHLYQSFAQVGKHSDAVTTLHGGSLPG